VSPHDLVTFHLKTIICDELEVSMCSQTNSDGMCVLYTDIAAALRLATARGRRVDPRFTAKINITGWDRTREHDLNVQEPVPRDPSLWRGYFRIEYIRVHRLHTHIQTYKHTYVCISSACMCEIFVEGRRI
jgi:hypothetical protein